MPRRLPLLLVPVVVGPLAALMAGAPAASAQRQPPELVQEGRRLYVTGCSSCHGLDGAGTDRAPSLLRSGTAAFHFYLSTGRMPIDEPRQQAVRKRPAYSDEQIDALVAYAATFTEGPGIPVVDPGAGDLAAGSQLYTQNCAACHNSAGSGGALGRATFAPAVLDASAVELAEAIRIGPGAMPQFGPDTVDDEQVASIVRYVEHLADPGDRGGLPLGRVGPVPEGLVAWVVGLGLMLAAARWIGTTT